MDKSSNEVKKQVTTITVATKDMELLSYELLEIMKTVKEGQPLLGECEQCPRKRFKISK